MGKTKVFYLVTKGNWGKASVVSKVNNLLENTTGVLHFSTVEYHCGKIGRPRFSTGCALLSSTGKLLGSFPDPFQAPPQFLNI